MSFVVKRKIDSLGRVVLPADYRNHFNIESGDSVQFTIAENGIIVSKAVQNTNVSKTKITYLLILVMQLNPVYLVDNIPKIYL